MENDMRVLIGLLFLALGSMTPAAAQLSLNFAGPGVRIGINVPVYPTLERIPGYPVYYAPGLDTNYFFYDGLYWDFDGENWYESSWYNGPWYQVDPFDVPVFLLRVPVRYYHHAPAYFRGWTADAPPRWGDHWGRSWETRRSGWDRWNRGSAPAPAPLPTYQRQYSGSRYPQQLAQQAAIQTRSYKYQPKDNVARQHFQQQRAQASSSPQAQSSTQVQGARRTQAAPQQQAAAPRREAIPQRTQPAQQAPNQSAERVQQAQQRERVQQAQKQQGHVQQAQQQREQHAQPAAQGQPQRQERVQQAQKQQQQHVQQAQQQREQHAQPAAQGQPQHAQRPAQQAQPREKAQPQGRGEERGKGHDKES
jgi:hypothetical protein